MIRCIVMVPYEGRNPGDSAWYEPGVVEREEASAAPRFRRDAPAESFSWELVPGFEAEDVAELPRRGLIRPADFLGTGAEARIEAFCDADPERESIRLRGCRLIREALSRSGVAGFERFLLGQTPEPDPPEPDPPELDPETPETDPEGKPETDLETPETPETPESDPETPETPESDPETPETPESDPEGKPETDPEESSPRARKPRATRKTRKTRRT